MKISKAGFFTFLSLITGVQISYARDIKNEFKLYCKDVRKGYFGSVIMKKDSFFPGQIVKAEFTDNYLVGYAVCIKEYQDTKLACTGYYLGINEVSFSGEMDTIGGGSYFLTIQRPKAYGGNTINVECSSESK
jgi:hypothetical protein